MKLSKRAMLLKLREDLWYHQMRGKMDRNSVKRSDEKCKEIGAEMRRLQKEISDEKEMADQRRTTGKKPKVLRD